MTPISGASSLGPGVGVTSQQTAVRLFPKETIQYRSGAQILRGVIANEAVALFPGLIFRLRVFCSFFSKQPFKRLSSGVSGVLPYGRRTNFLPPWGG